MIINVPTAEDFTRAGCNLLNLAWSQVDGLLAGLSDFEKDTSLESLQNVSPGLVPIREAEPETKKERTGATRLTGPPQNANWRTPSQSPIKE